MASHIPGNNSMEQAMAAAKTVQQNRQDAAAGKTVPEQPANPASPSDGVWTFGRPNVSATFDMKENTALYDTFAAALAKINTPGLSLIEISNTVEPQWFMSSITVVYSTPAGTAILPILLEQTALSDDPTPAKIPVPNSSVTVEVARTLDAAYDSEYRARIVAETVKVLGLQIEGGVVKGLTTAPAMLLARSFDLNSPSAMNALLRRIGTALRDMIAEQRTNFPDVNVKKLKSAAKLVIAATPLNRGTNLDVAGYPTRVDFTARVSSQNNNQQQTQSVTDLMRLNSGQGGGEDLWSTFGSMMDFAILPDPTRSGLSTPHYKRFALETVITAPEMHSAATTAAFLFSLSLMPAMINPMHLVPLLFDRNRNYAQAFGTGFNPGDLGVLNTIANWQPVQGQPPLALDTQSSAFTEGDFRRYMTDIIAAYALSIDLPRAGAYSAVTSVLASIASPDKEESAKGLAQLTLSLNRMSDNKFGVAFFGANNAGQTLTVKDVFSQVGNSIYMGSFPMKIGDATQDVDLRMIDTAAVIARFHATNPDMIAKWHQSSDVNNVNPFLRMALKREVIEAYTGGTYTITQVADRNTFNTRFIEALAACNVDNNLNLHVVFKDSLAGASTGFNAPSYISSAGGHWTEGASVYKTGGTTTATGGGYGAYASPNAGRY